MRLIVAAGAALLLATAAHAAEVAVFTGNWRRVFFPYWKLGIECEYRWREKIVLIVFFDKSSCPKVQEIPTPDGKGRNKTPDR
jgi:hypothetical protein